MGKIFDLLKSYENILPKWYWILFIGLVSYEMSLETNIVNVLMDTVSSL